MVYFVDIYGHTIGAMRREDSQRDCTRDRQLGKHILCPASFCWCAHGHSKEKRGKNVGGDANTSLSPQPSQTRIIKVGRTGARLSSGREGKHQARTERERGRKRMESARVLRLAERNPLALISLTASLLLRAFHFHLYALRALESAWIHFADVAERLCVCGGTAAQTLMKRTSAYKQREETAGE